MSLFLYLYYLGSVLLYGAALGVCFFGYGRTERQDLLYAGAMMFVRICDAVYAVTADLLQMTYSMHPLALTAALALTVVKIYLLGKIVYTLFGRAMPAGFDILLCVIVIVHGLLSTYPRELYWNLEPLSFSLSILIICGAYWFQWAQEEDPDRRRFASQYKHVIQAMLAFSLLGLLYMVTSLSLMQNPLSQNHVDLGTNCFYMFLAVWYIFFCLRELPESFAAEDGEGNGAGGEDAPACLDALRLVGASAAPESLTAFCRQYELTKRETEILELILSGKSNQEISDALYITVGTVKAHVHSIFDKLEVSRRSQLITRFLDSARSH